MGVRSLFESWRCTHKCDEGWGLAWYLAYEFCVRFYASHGIRPGVLEHEGLGYYGIQLEKVKCSVQHDHEPVLGRMTMSGDVENWLTGSPGDHGLKTTEMCDSGVALDKIVAASVEHMRLPVAPAKSHMHCRHRRRGKSYELMFSVATILALRNDYHRLKIWNHPYHTDQVVRETDPKANMSEHPGAFIFDGLGHRVVVSADGRLLGGEDINYWHRYMQGESAYVFALEIEAMLAGKSGSLLSS